MASNGLDISATSIAAMTLSVLAASVFYHFGFFLCVDRNLLPLVDYADYLRNSVLFLPFFAGMAAVGVLYRSLQGRDGLQAAPTEFGLKARVMFGASVVLFLLIIVAFPLQFFPALPLAALWLLYTLNYATDSLAAFSKKAPFYAYVTLGGSILTFGLGFDSGAKLILSSEFEHRIQIGDTNFPAKIIRMLSNYIIYQRQSDGRVCVARAAEKYTELFCSRDLPYVGPRIGFGERWQREYARQISVPNP